MSIELDDAQRRVAQAPADSRRLVIAGAGQGKTEVVAARLQYLAEDVGLSSSLELMVLSFSRAAVHAVRQRVEDHDLAETNVRTFDSFASYLLVENDIEPVSGFDNRIRQATRLLRDDDKDLAGIDEIEHLILDEVQDLVGDRAEMVLALLRRLDDSAGFTALGDPLQGIYDFTLHGSTSKMTSAEVFAALTGEFDATRVALEKNYRAQGTFPKRVVCVGDRLRDENNVDAAAGQIATFERTLPHSGVVNDWSFLAGNSGTTAILCETNGEVLQISRLLAAEGVQHVVRRSSRTFGAAPWLADVFESLAGPQVDRSDVEEAIERKLEASLQSEAWYLLKGAEGHSRSMHQLNLARLRNRIAARAIPLTLTQRDTADVIVSTVHRAKGLEFDNVFVVHRGYRRDDADEWALIHGRYVSLSRARSNVAMIDVPSENSWFKLGRGGRQRECRNSRRQKHYTAAVEITGDDVEDRRPVVTEGAEPADIQRAIRDLEPGVELTAVHQQSALGDECPAFALRTRGGDDIGLTNESFGRTLVDEFGYRFKDGWDGVVVRGIRLVAIETVACDPAVTEAAGLGLSGLMLVPRVTGLAVPEAS